MEKWIIERKRISGFRRISTVAFLLFLALAGRFNPSSEKDWLQGHTGIIFIPLFLYIEKHIYINVSIVNRYQYVHLFYCQNSKTFFLYF